MPKRAWVLLCAFGVVVTAIFVLVPVGTDFADDPLLRLGQLDPQLSPPDTTALCGSPLRAVGTASAGPTLYELARSHACQEAGERRLLVAVASGAAIVMFGLIGMANFATPPLNSAAEPPKTSGRALPSAVERNARERRSTSERFRGRQISRRPRQGKQVVR